MEKMSLPLAYAMKKKSAHMCHGGDCPHESHYAEGGSVGDESHRKDNEAGINRQSAAHPDKAGMSNIGALVRMGDSTTAKNIIKTKHEFGHKVEPKLMAQGGMAQEAEKLAPLAMMAMAKGGDAKDDCHPMVARIMKSRGGMIANDDEPVVDSTPNEFDDLALGDHLEGHNSGAADGDSEGNAQMEEDEHDMIARIMRSRAKKDRNPSPA